MVGARPGRKPGILARFANCPATGIYFVLHDIHWNFNVSSFLQVVASTAPQRQI